jgi:serine/threonine protein kinase/tetratricopeptide (TPR) repeat protein
MRIAPGDRLGPYVVESELGVGGMGRVYRARDTRLHRPVAIKVLSSEIAGPSARHRFEQEAINASALNHPHILTVHEAGETEGHPYLVTEFVDGGTLVDWVAAIRPTWQQIADLMAGVGDGLAAAHAAGILHRDIKPQNILVTMSGYAKLADFGLATLLDRGKVDGNAATETHLETQPGVVVGTLAYMSPEQATGQRLDARSDIFSFGVVLYELLAGRRPFQGSTPVAALHAIAHDVAPALPDHLPAPLRAIVDKALEKDPADRYQTMNDLAVDLRRTARPAAVPSARMSTRGRWPIITAAVAVVLIGVAWLTAGLRRTTAPDQTVIRSLAVLPLKPLTPGNDDAAVGLGLADTIITRIGQIDGLTVRPTSAVRKYSAHDASALDAARELQVEAVLDGTMHRAGDRLRVNMTLVRVGDGATLWSQTFNTVFADVFAVEDEIATGVVSQLRVSLSQAQRLRLTKHHTSSPEAYEYYLKGVATFTSTGPAAANIIGNSKAGIALLERAVAIDPEFALAHAQLAWGEMFVATTSGDVAAFSRARAALARADALDHNLAESHVVRHLLLWSGFSGYQIVEAFEALKAAQAINPNVGHGELGTFYAHVGMLNAGLSELERAIEIDPTSETARADVPNSYWYNARYDEAIKANQALTRPVPWAYSYYLGAGRLDEARGMIDAVLARDPSDGGTILARARLLAMQGRHAEARALLKPPPPDAALSRTFHHATYQRACIYALGNDAKTSVEWLERTVETGMPNYPAFARDKCFDSIRSSVPFTQFMARLKPVWDGYDRRMQYTPPQAVRR